MRLVFVTILTLILLGFHNQYTVNAANSAEQSNNQLVKLTREIHTLSRQQEYEHALSLLQHFSEEFLQSEKMKDQLTMNELRLVSSGYTEAKNALTAASLDVDERTNVVLSFHLLIDAIYSEHQPMWRNTKDKIINPLENMRVAVDQGNEQDFMNYLKEFKANYNQIKPALEVDLESDQINRLDSYISYLDQFNGQLFSGKDKTLQHVNVMKAEFQILFDETEKESADLSLPWLIFTIGGVIVSTLVYVGWIKYRAEREKIRKFNRGS
jgi:sporulation protein YpjB